MEWETKQKRHQMLKLSKIEKLSENYSTILCSMRLRLIGVIDVKLTP